MPQTNQTDLKARCIQLGLQVNSDNPTPAEIIPVLEHRLAEHRSHWCAQADQNTVDYIDWKLTLNNLTQFLAQLRSSVPRVPAVPHPSPSNPPVIPPFPANFLLERRPRRDDKIANMSPQDRETLLHWLECGHSYRKVVQMAAQPRPEGLDIKLSASMLSRFHQKHVIADQLEDAIELAREISPQSTNPESALRQLSEAFALRMLSSPDADADTFHKITRYLVRQRALDLQQKRLAHVMQHKHYDIFKRTIQKLPEINRIVRDQSLTPEERMREFCAQQFGIETVEMIDEANEKYEREHPNEPSTEPEINEDDLIPPLTPEENQQAVNEALDVMIGPDPDEVDEQPTAQPNSSYPSNATYSPPSK